MKHVLSSVPKGSWELIGGDNFSFVKQVMGTKTFFMGIEISVPLFFSMVMTCCLLEMIVTMKSNRLGWFSSYKGGTVITAGSG